jgi:hypothetical protein
MVGQADQNQLSRGLADGLPQRPGGRFEAHQAPP